MPILISFGVWVWRIGEIAFLNPRENARRVSAHELVTVRRQVPPRKLTSTSPFAIAHHVAWVHPP